MIHTFQNKTTPLLSQYKTAYQGRLIKPFVGKLGLGYFSQIRSITLISSGIRQGPSRKKVPKNPKVNMHELQERGNQFQLNCYIYLTSHKINGTHLYLAISNLAVSWHLLPSYFRINEVWKTVLVESYQRWRKGICVIRVWLLLCFPLGIRRQGFPFLHSTFSRVFPPVCVEENTVIEVMGSETLGLSPTFATC